MLGQTAGVAYQIKAYAENNVARRRDAITQRISRLVKVVNDVLKEVEVQEPRFISTLVPNDTTGRYDGLYVHSPSEFEVLLYLNQMGVLNFVDDGSIPGNAVLKLSDGRKRSMSLWVEFITASGYLSARKIRGRFQSIVQAVCEKAPFRGTCRVLDDTTDVKIRIDDLFTVQMTCAFRCNGIWPRSAAHWPNPSSPWPPQHVASQVKSDGFDLCSRENSIAAFMKGNPAAAQPQQPGSSMDGDAYSMTMYTAESTILTGQRRRCLSILKCLRDSHLDHPQGTPVDNFVIKTLLLGECEKHPHDYEWDDPCLGDRIIGVLLQLVSCLQCRRCPHYFLPQMDLLRGKGSQLADGAARQTWSLLRTLMLDARALESL